MSQTIRGEASSDRRHRVGKIAAVVREMPFAGEISLEFLPSADALESLKRSHDLFCREFWT